MATDFAIDYNTGDLLRTSTGDLSVRTGQKTIEQKIRVRLRIAQGEWKLDPTNGTLGSRLKQMFSLPTWRAKDEVELVIREALEPMEEITVENVAVSISPTDSRTLQVIITYNIREDGEDEDVQTIETTVVTVG